MSSLSARPIYERLKPLRIEKYNDPDVKIVIDPLPTGTGKTYTAIEHFLRNYKHTTCIINNHKLADEIYYKLTMGEIYKPFKESKRFGFNIAPFHGRSAKISNYTIAHQRSAYNREFYKIPCRRFIREKLELQMYNRGLYPKNACSKCQFQFNCFHHHYKKQILSSLDYYLNNLFLMPKSYLHTKLIDRIDELEENCLISDENMFSLLFREIKVYPIFGERLLRLVRKLNDMVHGDLKDFYQFVFDLQHKLSDICNNPRYKYSGKITLYADWLQELYSNYKISEIENQNEQFKEFCFKQRYHIQKEIAECSNVIDRLIAILKDIKEKRIKDISKNVFVDKEYHILQYTINHRDKIKKIFDKFKKIIITDALMRPEFLTSIFPEYINDFSVVDGISTGKLFDNVYIYNRGKYGKNTLLKKLGGFTKTTPSLENLINISKNIIEYRYTKNNEDINLICSFSGKILNKIKEEMNKFDFIKNHDIELNYVYWYNLEGLDYRKCQYGIEIGSCNIKDAGRKRLSALLNINKNQLDWLYGPGQHIQFGGRFRSILRDIKDLPTLYVLTNEWMRFYPNETFWNGKFISIEYKELLNYISKNNPTRAQIIGTFGYSNDKFKEVIDELFKNNLISKIELPKSTAGRKKTLYKTLS